MSNDVGICNGCGGRVDVRLIYGAMGYEWGIVRIEVTPHKCKNK